MAQSKPTSCGSRIRSTSKVPPGPYLTCGTTKYSQVPPTYPGPSTFSPCELSSFTSSPPLLLQGNRRSDPFSYTTSHFQPFLIFQRTLNFLGHPLSHLPFLYLSVCWGPLFQSRCTARLPCAFDRPNALPTQQRHPLSSSHLSFPPGQTLIRHALNSQRCR